MKKLSKSDKNLVRFCVIFVIIVIGIFFCLNYRGML